MNPLPTRQLREHPDFDQLKRQAKELLEGYRNGVDAATAEVRTHYKRSAESKDLTLSHAQLVLARSYGSRAGRS